MGSKLWCYEPRCLLLLMTTSVLLLPLRDSFQCQPGHVAGAAAALRRRCRRQHLPASSPPRPWTPCCTLLPTRQPPRFLRPLKDWEREPDVAGSSNEEGAGEDDSDSSNTAAEGGNRAARAELGVGDDGASTAEAAAAAAAVGPGRDLETEVASFEFAPPMTVRKFKTMQDRRVPVSIKYSGGGGFKRYFEEIAIVLKRHFPDVIIDREIVEVSSSREEEVFEIRIDGKLVCSKRRGKPGVFLPMETFEQAIRKARQRRRPGSIVYGDQETYQNVKALTDRRTADDSLERDFKDFSEPGAGDNASPGT